MNADRVSFSFLFVIALYGLVTSFMMPLGQLQEPGPGFFPLCLSSLLVVLSGLGILSSGAAKDAPPTGSLLGDIKTPLKIILATALAIFAFEPVGFLLTSVSFLAFLFAWVSRYAWWKSVAMGVAGGLTGWFFFVKLLGVPMPVGFFGF